jgi:hypothetical protein
MARPTAISADPLERQILNTLSVSPTCFTPILLNFANPTNSGRAQPIKSLGSALYETVRRNASAKPLAFENYLMRHTRTEDRAKSQPGYLALSSFQRELQRGH